MSKPVSMVVLVVAAVLLWHCPCTALDVWEDVIPGVRHLHRTTSTPWDIHILTIDLTNPRVNLRVGIKNDHDKSDGGETVRSMCLRYDAVAGINTDFWGDSPVSHCPQGYTMTDGLMMLPPNYKSPINGSRSTLMIPTDNAYALINLVSTPLPWWYNVTAGGPRMIRNGVVAVEAEPDVPDQISRHPRTAAALTQNLRTLILATCDGRQSDSAGMTGVEMGNLLLEFGGYQGMMFDGGASTTMVVNGSTVNDPSDAGGDRAVAACLMVLDNNWQAVNPTVQYETSFENLPYTAGSISGTDGWNGTGSVVSGGTSTGSQCARFLGQSALRNGPGIAGADVQWVECYARCSSTNSGAYLYAGTADLANTASAVRFNSSGQIEALDGNGTGSGTWVSLGSYTADTWYRVHVRLDYNLSSYQTFVNGAMKASGLGFKHSGASIGLRSVRLEETGGASELLVDDVYLGNVDPSFVRVSPNTAPIVQGGMKQFRAASGAAGTTWSVVDEKNQAGAPVPAGTIAQVGSTGVVTALAPGSFVLQVQEPSGRTDRSGQMTVSPSQTIPAVKELADGAAVGLSGVIVTARYADSVYVETPDRSSGIRIASTKTVSEGATAYVVGTLGTANGERVIYPTALEAF